MEAVPDQGFTIEAHCPVNVLLEIKTKQNCKPVR